MSHSSWVLRVPSGSQMGSWPASGWSEPSHLLFLMAAPDWLLDWVAPTHRRRLLCVMTVWTEEIRSLGHVGCLQVCSQAGTL